jgi:hypothetical protein
MITIKDIIKWSKPHPISLYSKEKGRQSRFGNKKIEFSIVGGQTGLYGDFKKTFEVAIFDVESGEFVTKFFYPESGDDIIPYMGASDVEKLVNTVLKIEDLSIEK